MSDQHTQSHRHRIASLDAKLSARVRQLVALRPKVGSACLLVAHAGDGTICIAALAVAALLLPSTRIAVARMLVASLLAAGLVGAGKLAFRRPRPIAGESHRWSSLGRHDTHAFPSGHAARTASIAAVASYISPALGLAAWAWSIGVSLCRVALGAHYAGDILVGLAMGTLAAWVVQALGWP